MLIPIENLYHVLSYALSEFYAGSPRGVSGTRSPHPVDLLCSLLNDEVDSLLKRGLYRSYVAAEVEDGTVRGQIDFQTSIKLGLIARRRLVCRHDDMAEDGPLNRILKATLLLVAGMSGVNSQIRRTAGRLASRFPGVSEVELDARSYQVRIDRNLKRYSLAIGICRLVRDLVLVDREGRTSFVDFARDEIAMRLIFEKFVRNLLTQKLEAPLSISRKRFPFKSLGGDAVQAGLVPTMTSDAVVSSPHATLVIEVKYVAGATEEYRGLTRLRSPHLYQILSYLRNIPSQRAVGGILIYPSVGRKLSTYFRTAGTLLAIEELDLSRNWPDVEQQLISAVRRTVMQIEALPEHQAA